MQPDFTDFSKSYQKTQRISGGFQADFKRISSDFGLGPTNV